MRHIISFTLYFTLFMLVFQAPKFAGNDPNWLIYGSPRMEEETRKLNAAVRFLWDSWPEAPKRARIEFEIAPPISALERAYGAEAARKAREESPVYAYAYHYLGGKHVITVFPRALSHDWRIRSVLLHELVHVNLNEAGVDSRTKCGILVHEIRATRAEQNHFHFTGVPTTGEGAKFRMANRGLLRDYRAEFAANNCN